MLIKSLFGPSQDIYRTIEKVITYGAAQEARLRAEIAEYIVTDSMEAQFEDLLRKMQLAMEQGGRNEIGVWVSGFYGSGKSSFTKYLGLALDETVQVDGVRFLRHLQDRLNTPQTRALLNTTAARYPAAVVFLDLASEMLAGATMEDVATVLYYKVLQWAGYSRNLKVAALERRLQADGRYEAFSAHIESELGVPWTSIQNDPLVIDSLLPDIAHEFYPELFRTATAFSTETVEYVHSLRDQVEEMLAIVRRHSGKQHVLFVIDEVGQYVSERKHLILNLQGLAENLKTIGDGKAWIIATAQQTLTEDDPRAALNSPELYKLKDRFPIQIDLEADDIREICRRRLLGKSSQGEQALGELFERHGQALRHNTRLQDARYYDSDFDRRTFVDLYPFLPAHFDILLHLLGALAKSTGGFGLRSAIKVIQDILIEGAGDQPPVADQPLGWLATTVTLYDSLERDIRRAFPSIHSGVEKARLRFPDAALPLEVAKTVAVLQILGNMPVTPQNVASLLHPRVDAAGRREQVDAAIAALAGDPIVPFGEKEGNLCFFSEKINDIDQERAQLSLRGIETRRIQNEALRELWNPLPATQLQGAVTVTTGLKAMMGSMMASLAGDRETIQTVVEFVEPTDYDAARSRLVDESRQRTATTTIFLPGRAAAELDDKVAEIYRCREIVQRYHNDPDQEVKDYCTTQRDRADRLTGDLQRLLARSLSQGSFIFRGQMTAVDSLDHDLLQAARKHLATVAAQVFDRYDEAPVRADTTLAERFLRAGSLNAITAAIDPLGLVQISGGAPRIQSDHKALLSIRDAIDRQGAMEGKRLIDLFTGAPFGWSQDTLRYLVAAMLVAGEVKLKVAGREVTVNGQQAIEALRTNNSFKNVGVALRDGRPSLAVLARAAQRLTELLGESVIPLEAEISKAAIKLFPRLQHRFGPLAEKLRALALPGADTVAELTQDLAEILLSDASDAAQRLGAEDSVLYDSLKWANEVELALRKGLEETVRDLQWHRHEIEALPQVGVTAALQADLGEDLGLVGQRLSQPTFYHYAADLNTLRTSIKARVRDAAIALAGSQQQTLTEAAQDLQRLPAWSELTQEEQSQTLARLENLTITATPDLLGIKRLLNQILTVQARLSALKREVDELGHQRQLARQRSAQLAPLHDAARKGPHTFPVPSRLTTLRDLEDLILQLQALKSQLADFGDIEITFEVIGDR